MLEILTSLTRYNRKTLKKAIVQNQDRDPKLKSLKILTIKNVHRVEQLKDSNKIIKSKFYHGLLYDFFKEDISDKVKREQDQVFQIEEEIKIVWVNLLAILLQKSIIQVQMIIVCKKLCSILVRNYILRNDFFKFYLFLWFYLKELLFIFKNNIKILIINIILIKF